MTNELTHVRAKAVRLATRLRNFAFCLGLFWLFMAGWSLFTCNIVAFWADLGAAGGCAALFFAQKMILIMHKTIDVQQQHIDILTNT